MLVHFLYELGFTIYRRIDSAKIYMEHVSIKIQQLNGSIRLPIASLGQNRDL